MNTPLIVGAGSALFCTWMLINALHGYKKSLASRGWPSVNGKLLKLELWGKRNVDGEMRDVERLSIEYSYDVHGVNHKASTAAFYTLVYPETVDFASNHPESSEVTVYYQPTNPAESVLVPGPKPGNKRYSDILLASFGLVVSLSISILGALGRIG